MKICVMCDREVKVLTRHHLVPRSRGGSKKEVILVCLSCKDMLHRLFNNKELERELNTLDKIMKDSAVQKYIRWIKKQKREHVNMKLKKKKR